MPELPEVETIRRDLEALLLGQAVTSATLKDSRLLTPARWHEWRRQVIGQRWTALLRHGKYLMAELSSGWRVVFHLRMTGQLVVEAPNAEGRYRLAMVFDNGRQLSFYDQRRFGETWLLAPGQAWHSKNLPGPDALTELSAETFLKLLKRPTKIHALLLDQRRLSGVGNIYSQEALFKALIRPSRPGERISALEGQRLFTALQATLQQAIEHRGSSSRNYRDAWGQEGTAQRLHAVYRKGGKPCPRCKQPLRAMRLGGRGAVYCSKCQK